MNSPDRLHLLRLFAVPRWSFTSRLGSIAVLALLALASPPAEAASIVVPNNLATTEGNDANFLPFAPSPSERYQQVYGASQFSSLIGGGFITQIIFRPDGFVGAAFTSTLPSIRIDLSTTSAAPDALSSTFASNVGANDTIVYGGLTGAPLTLSSANTGPAGGPKDFDIVINLSSPFFYDPTLGNLLLDVRNFGGGMTTFFDAENTAGDSVSRVGTLAGGNGNSATADLNDTLGLVTQFTFVAVPEPATLALVVVGFLIIATRAAYAKRRTTDQAEAWNK
jgi:hypothetical protein